MKLTNLSSDQLFGIKCGLKKSIKHLVERGALRTVEEDNHLKAQRALMLQVQREIKKCVSTLPMF